MSTWQNFEIDATKYLNDNYGSLATFIHEGGSDSTIPDILVELHNGKQFYIEVKLSNAQCGQFVLQPDIKTSTFVYTARNTRNQYANEIIEFMNNDFEKFKEAGTAGKRIEMNQYVFVNWIEQTYLEKGVRWFITEDFILIPISKLGLYFDVTATYRVKRSGSNCVGKAKMDKVISKINSLDVSGSITNIIKLDSKLFVESNKNIHNQRFIYDGCEYMFSLRHDKYEVRKLSNTFNANVIFSVSLKNKADKYKNQFVNYLKG